MNLIGSVDEPKGISGRIITLSVFLSYLFLNVAYSACILNLIQSADTSIKTLEDLMESPIKAGADNVEYSQRYFAVSFTNIFQI